ncbi:Hypothetical predicted protein [Octopus vulgaris]|uniref:Uncharacterized protein n=1 Tax=Octopus vulgaris TaxID=6645 RepID=A0AA36BPH3_OCTVU|nr:Hypothetical predicted protein [Octopus vulgaris]
MFFSYKGIVHDEYAPTGQTVNKENYCDVLRCLWDAIHRERPQLHASGVVERGGRIGDGGGEGGKMMVICLLDDDDDEYDNGSGGGGGSAGGAGGVSGGGSGGDGSAGGDGVDEENIDMQTLEEDETSINNRY